MHANVGEACFTQQTSQSALRLDASLSLSLSLLSISRLVKGRKCIPAFEFRLVSYKPSTKVQILTLAKLLYFVISFPGARKTPRLGPPSTRARNTTSSNTTSWSSKYSSAFFSFLEALTVYDDLAGVLVFVRSYPHLLERRQRRQDRRS